MLQYGLIENLLTAALNDYMATTQNVRSYSENEIIDMMMQRGTTITRTDIKAMLQLYKEVIASLVADGSAINTELINVSPSISGVFTNATDVFDPARHRINVNLTPGTALRDAGTRIAVQKIELTTSAPYIAQVTDAVTGDSATLTAGNVLRLAGARLRFLADRPANGVFLIPADGGAELRCDTVIENKPSRLMVILPAATAAGDYYVEVRTTYTNSSGAKETKTLKTGRYARPLPVVAPTPAG